MTCAQCGAPSNGNLCQDCARENRQERYYGTVDDEYWKADQEDEDDE